MLAEEAAAGRVDRAAVSAVLEAAGQVRRVAAPNDLTARETEILKLLARGLVDKEIAAQLGISHRTVHHHNQSIFGKIGVTTRGAAALFAIERALLWGGVSGNPGLWAILPMWARFQVRTLVFAGGLRRREYRKGDESWTARKRKTYRPSRTATRRSHGVISRSSWSGCRRCASNAGAW
ncbi:MAG: response regulator transcription factor [Betaproteobacteria bacterium]|nr:response regulator transcription factor [Betaproteobacteria bacterium]